MAQHVPSDVHRPRRSRLIQRVFTPLEVPHKGSSRGRHLSLSTVSPPAAAPLIRWVALEELPASPNRLAASRLSAIRRNRLSSAPPHNHSAPATQTQTLALRAAFTELGRKTFLASAPGLSFPGQPSSPVRVPDPPAPPAGKGQDTLPGPHLMRLAAFPLHPLDGSPPRAKSCSPHDQGIPSSYALSRQGPLRSPP